MFQRNNQQILQQQQYISTSQQTFQQMPPIPPNQQQYMIIKQQQNVGLPYEMKNNSQIWIPQQQQVVNSQHQIASPQISGQQLSYQQNGVVMQKQQSQQQEKIIQIAQQNQNTPALHQSQNNNKKALNFPQNGNSIYSQTSSTQNTQGNSRVISPERRIEEVDSFLQQENEKLNKQYNHLDNLLNTFCNFELTKNIEDLKKFNQKNLQFFSDLIDEIYDYKAKIEEEKKKGEQLRSQQIDHKVNMNSSQVSSPVNGPLLSLQNQELQKKLDSIREEQNKTRSQINQLNNKKNQIDYYAETKEQIQQQIQNLEETQKQLQQEVNKFDQNQISKWRIQAKKIFFKEYDFMCREKRGLNDQNDKIGKEIKLKDEELNKLKGKQEAPFPQCGMGLPPPSRQ